MNRERQAIRTSRSATETHSSSFKSHVENRHIRTVLCQPPVGLLTGGRQSDSKSCLAKGYLKIECDLRLIVGNEDHWSFHDQQQCMSGEQLRVGLSRSDLSRRLPIRP